MAAGRPPARGLDARSSCAFAARGAETFTDHDSAVLARIDPDGSTHVAADGLHFANGAVITPDGRTLLVLTCSTSVAHDAAQARTGRIETVRVTVPGAGHD